MTNEERAAKMPKPGETLIMPPFHMPKEETE